MLRALTVCDRDCHVVLLDHDWGAGRTFPFICTSDPLCHLCCFPKSIYMPPPPPPPAEMEWSALPLELLQEIVKKLASVVEFVRFRAVCRPWRSAASPADLPPQQPWLMLPCNPYGDTRSFFCLSTGIVRVLRLPETRNKRICGSGHGWFILFDYATTVVTLFNPLTGSLISLPRLTGSFISLLRLRVPAGMLLSASLSANPTSSSGCIVAVWITRTPQVVFCRLRPGGSRRWSKLNMKLGSWVTSIAIHLGKLCVIDVMDSLMIWDTPQRRLTVADLCVKLPFLGEGWTLLHCQLVDSLEDLLLVAYGCEVNPAASRGYCSVIYRLDSESQQLNMVVSESIVGGVVSESIGDVCSFYANVPVYTSVYVACRECLYFARYWVNDGEQSVNVMVKELDLKKDGSKELQFESGYGPGFTTETAWLVPSLIIN